jgi:hypothetical protein
MAYKVTETDMLYGVAMDHVMMAYKGTETCVLFGVESWRHCSHKHCSCKSALFNCQMTECYRVSGK